MTARRLILKVTLIVMALILKTVLLVAGTTFINKELLLVQMIIVQVYTLNVRKMLNGISAELYTMVSVETDSGHSSPLEYPERFTTLCRLSVTGSHQCQVRPYQNSKRGKPMARVIPPTLQALLLTTLFNGVVRVGIAGAEIVLVPEPELARKLPPLYINDDTFLKTEQKSLHLPHQNILLMPLGSDTIQLLETLRESYPHLVRAISGLNWINFQINTIDRLVHILAVDSSVAQALESIIINHGPEGTDLKTLFILLGANPAMTELFGQFSGEPLIEVLLALPQMQGLIGPLHQLAESADQQQALVSTWQLYQSDPCLSLLDILFACAFGLSLERLQSLTSLVPTRTLYAMMLENPDIQQLIITLLANPDYTNAQLQPLFQLLPHHPDLVQLLKQLFRNQQTWGFLNILGNDPDTLPLIASLVVHGMISTPFPALVAGLSLPCGSSPLQRLLRLLAADHIVWETPYQMLMGNQTYQSLGYLLGMALAEDREAWQLLGLTPNQVSRFIYISLYILFTQPQLYPYVLGLPASTQPAMQQLLTLLQIQAEAMNRSPAALQMLRQFLKHLYSPDALRALMAVAKQNKPELLHQVLTGTSTSREVALTLLSRCLPPDCRMAWQGAMPPFTALITLLQGLLPQGTDRDGSELVQASTNLAIALLHAFPQLAQTQAQNMPIELQTLFNEGRLQVLAVLMLLQQARQKDPESGRGATKRR